ncbi:MAG: hypothetical protein HQ581_24985, partial [Planctomycetes bacterium]|nr:hypothetical protein [Planctomycetota bacterium]
MDMGANVLRTDQSFFRCARRYGRLSTALFLGIWILLLVAGRSKLFRDPGTFWHTSFGQRMLETGEPIGVDSWSFTHAGQPWVASQWAPECVMALVYRLGGWDALLLVAVSLLAALYAWVGARLHGRGLHPIGVVLLIALVLAASSHQFHVRPLILSLVFTAATFALLVDVEAGRTRLRALWWLPPLFVVWTNVHGGVLGGLGTLGLVAGGWISAALLGRASPVENRRQGVQLALVVAACMLSVLVNPYGLDLPRTWFTVLRLPLVDLVQEHAPLFRSDGMESAMTVLLGALYAVALVGVLPRWPRIIWLLPVVWFVLACGRIRHAPLFALTAALALADMLPHTRWAEWLRRHEFLTPQESPPGDRPRQFSWRPALIPAIVVIATLSLTCAAIRLPGLPQPLARFDPSHWPVEMVEPLHEIGGDGPGETRIFNEDR